jgi:RHS repeat-associated protein
MEAEDASLLHTCAIHGIGALNLKDCTVSMSVYYDPGSTGTIDHCTGIPGITIGSAGALVTNDTEAANILVSASATIENSLIGHIDISDGTPQIHGNTISSDIPYTLLRLSGEGVAGISGNTYTASGLRIYIGGGAVEGIWDVGVVDGIGTYELIAYSTTVITVPAGSALKILPGIQVTANGISNIMVYGSMEAEDASLLHTCAIHGIGALNLKDCVVSMSVYYDTGSTGTIDHCTGLPAINIASAGALVTNNTEAANISVSASATIEDSLIGHFDISGGTPQIHGNTISSDVPYTLWRLSGEGVGGISGNTYTAGGLRIYIGGGGVEGNWEVGVVDGISKYELIAYNTTVITVPLGTSFSILPNVKVTANGITVMNVYGGMGADSAILAGTCQINAYSGSVLFLYGSIIEAGIGVGCREESNAIIKFSTFQGPLSVHATANAVVKYNDFTQSTVYTEGISSAIVNIENNWWGTTDSLQIASRIHDHTDDENIPYGDYEPFLVFPLPLAQMFYGNQTAHTGFSNDPVNTAIGNFTHEETDIAVISRGKPLAFTRYYNSLDTRASALGTGWTHNYNISLIEDTQNNKISVCWEDGRTDYWVSDGSGGYKPAQPWLHDTLAKNGGNWQVKKQNLDIYTFDSQGRLTSITDKNNNSLNLAYNNADYPKLATTISDDLGRSLTISYDQDGFLTSVVDFGQPPRAVQYAYNEGRLTRVTDVSNNHIDYEYDQNGYLTKITNQKQIIDLRNVYDTQGRVIEQYDGNNNKTQFAYDTPQANQTTITDALGKISIHTHDELYKTLLSIKNPLGFITFYGYNQTFDRTAVTDLNGRTTTYTYDANGNITSVTDPDDPNDPNDGGITLIEYADARFPFLPTKKTDALGNITRWEYDANGNVTRQLDALNQEKLWTYNGFGQKLTEQDERGAACLTQYLYNAEGLLTETINAQGAHTWYQYDTYWRAIKITDGRGSAVNDPDHTTEYAYDNADRLISMHGPLTTKTYQFDAVGNLISEVNPRGFATTHTYDNNNNRLTTQRPGPDSTVQTITIVYDVLNRKITTQDPLGNQTYYFYDDAGRLIKTANAESNELNSTYDAQGNLLSATDGSGVTISYEYDALNRKIHQYDQLGHHAYWTYDTLGRLSKQTDANGAVTENTYDALSRLVKVKDAKAHESEYQYDAVGNLTQAKDGAGKIILKKTYDKISRLTRQEDGLGHYYEYGYDAANNQTSVKDANGGITTLVYDNENRLITAQYPNLSQASFSYDANSNLTAMVDPTGTTTYVYDVLDRLISCTDPYNKTVAYNRDLANNLIGITYPADSSRPARNVAYAYDHANRLKTITDWQNRVFSFTIDAAGRINEVSYPNGMKETHAYDGAGRLTSLNYKKSDNIPLLGYAYTYDANGNITLTQENETLSADVNSLVSDVNYTYDNDNRLTQTDEPTTYTYDNNGNLLILVKAGNTTTYTYDYENRLISRTQGTTITQHTYDARGNRIARSDNGTVLKYVLDRAGAMSQVLCETDSAGETKAYYIYGPRLAARVNSTGETRYYLTDHIGNVAALADENQNITDRYAYTPFGVNAGREGTTDNPFTYIGALGVMAEPDNTYFMRARFYDAQTGRFLGKDPVESTLTQPFGLNRYVYAWNNPLIGIDPSGEVAWGSFIWSSVQVVGSGVGFALSTAATFTGGGAIVGVPGMVFSASSLYQGVANMKAAWNDNGDEQDSLIQDLVGCGYVLGRNALNINTTQNQLNTFQEGVGITEDVASLAYDIATFDPDLWLKRGGGGHLQLYELETGRYAAFNLFNQMRIFDEIYGGVSMAKDSYSLGSLFGNTFASGNKNAPFIQQLNIRDVSSLAKGLH